MVSERLEQGQDQADGNDRIATECLGGDENNQESDGREDCRMSRMPAAQDSTGQAGQGESNWRWQEEWQEWDSW
jgi:hypothetical protein